MVSKFWNRNKFLDRARQRSRICSGRFSSININIIPGYRSSSAYTNTEQATTLANIPTGVVANTIDRDSIIVSWNGDATEYYVFDIFNPSTNSDWITGTSYTFNNLNCGVFYSFSVRGRNSIGNETTDSEVVSNRTADCPAPLNPTSVIAENATNESMDISWTPASGGIETNYIVQKSTNGFSFSTIATVPAIVTSYQARDLFTDTSYWFRIQSTDGTIISSGTVSSPLYTLANIPGIPTLTSETSNTIKVVIDPANNPFNTGYFLYDSTTNKYLQSDYSWGDVSTRGLFGYFGLGGPNGATTIGISPNSLHSINVASVNGNGIVRGGSAANVYTLASIPANVTTNANNNSAITVSWNGDATDYYVLESSGMNSDWITGTSYTFNNLNCGAFYSFRVKGNNAVGAETIYSNDFGQSTQACDPTVNAPTDLQVDFVTNETVDLSWTSGRGSESTFIIEQSLNGNDFSVVGFTQSLTTSYRAGSVSPLEPGTQYWFRVRATDWSTYSAYTNTAQATTNANPPPPPQVRDPTGLATGAV
ncbi:fibronectin type III domain-containing protein, partial [Candidatus Woesearchaeota archaeon]|nr:fibronectin type III domain-containing protein [Candidatus Woesearchaeota archaeon]